MLRDTIDTLSPVAAATGIDSFANDPGVLWVRVAPGPTSQLHGLRRHRSSARRTGRTLSFTPGTVFTQGALFEVIATPPPTA